MGLKSDHSIPNVQCVLSYFVDKEKQLIVLGLGAVGQEAMREGEVYEDFQVQCEVLQWLPHPGDQEHKSCS